MKKPRTTLVLDDVKEVTFDEFIRPVRHLAGAVLAATAIGVALISPILSAVIMAAMIATLKFRYRLTLNVERRTYRIVRGFSPRAGTFGDLKGIMVERHVVQGENTSTESYMVSLLWVNGREWPWDVSHRTTLEGAKLDAEAAALHLSLPIFEGPQLVAHRAEIEATQERLSKI